MTEPETLTAAERALITSVATCEIERVDSDCEDRANAVGLLLRLYDDALARAAAEERARAMRMTCRVNEADNTDQCDRRRAAESRLAEALARVEDLERACYSDGHGAHAEDLLKLRAAESALASARTYAQNAFAYLNDAEDLESTPLHAIGHARTELRALLSSHPAPAPVAAEPTLVERIEATVNRWTRFGIAGDCAREILALIQAAKEGA